MYSNDFICDLIQYIETNLYSRITIDALSLKFSYNRYYLMKLFKKELNISIIDFIHHFRIYRSIQEMQFTDFSITRIAINVGFSSLEYYSEVFHQVMGVSAKEFRFYTKNHYLDDKEKISILLTHWFDLQSLFERIERYKKNRKPSMAPILKRTIFD